MARNKNLIFGVVFVLAVMGLLVFQGATAQTEAPKTGFENICPRDKGIAVCVQQIYVLALGLGSIVALLMIVLAGYRYMTAAGNAQQVENAKEAFASAFIGLIVIFVAFILLYLINPDLVKFQGLKFPKTNTTKSTLTAPPEDESVDAGTGLLVQFNFTTIPNAQVDSATGAVSIPTPAGNLILTPNLTSSLPYTMTQTLQAYGLDPSGLTLVEYTVSDPALLPDSMVTALGGNRPSRIFVVKGSFFIFDADAMHEDTTGETILQAVGIIAQAHFGVNIAVTPPPPPPTPGTPPPPPPGGTNPLPANYGACQKFLFDHFDWLARMGSSGMFGGNSVKIRQISVDQQCKGAISYQTTVFSNGQIQTKTTDTYIYDPGRTRESWRTQLQSLGLDPNRFVFLPFSITRNVEGVVSYSQSNHTLLMNACDVNANYFGWDNVSGWVSWFSYLDAISASKGVAGLNCAAGYPISQIPAPTQTLARTYSVPATINVSIDTECVEENFCEDLTTGARSAPGPSGCPPGTRQVVQCFYPEEDTACTEEFGFEQRNCLAGTGQTLPDGRCAYHDQTKAVCCGMAGSGQYCLPGYKPAGCVEVSVCE